MYRRILVPVDGSATSKLGLKEAIGLAKREGARLRVLNVLDEKLLVPGVDAYAAADLTALIGVLNLEGRRAVKDAAALARRRGVQVDTKMEEGRGRIRIRRILPSGRHAEAYRAHRGYCRSSV